MKNSPSYDCGLKPDDVIEEINGQVVDSLSAAFKILVNKRKVRIKIRRGGRILFFSMKERKEYPYIFEGQRKREPFGIKFKLQKEVMLSDDDVRDIERYALIHDAKKMLVLTSARAYYLLKYKIQKLNLLKNSERCIKLVIAENVMYGGHTKCANLLIVDDFIRAINRHKRKFRPDLVLLPATPFNEWGRDVIGRVNLDIERKVKIPVEFIYNYNLD